MNQKKGSCFVVLLFISLTMEAQTAIKSIVVDSNKNSVLDGATVSLLRLPDSVLLRQTRSLRNGFVFRSIKAGSYLIKTSFIGYQNNFSLVRISGADSIQQLVSVKMQPGSPAMMEVIIRSTIPPVISKSDTLVYNAASFKTGPNASVEDLLKKLPGVQVDAKGQVTVNGQKVDKFYIDGKEIPVNDARSLTQNLTAEMLQSVETFDRQSDDSRFARIRDSENAKALNFKIKKAFQRSITGRVLAGWGTNDYYAAGGNAFLILPDSKLQLTLNRNNSNDLLGAGGIRQYNNAGGIISKTSAELRGNTIFSKSLSAMGEYGFNNISARNENTGMRQTFLVDSSLLSNNSTTTNDLNRMQLIDLNLRYKLDSATEITIHPKLNNTHSEDQSASVQAVNIQKASFRYLSATATTNNQSVTNNTGAGADFTMRHRFHKKGETVSFRFSYDNQNATSEKSFVSGTKSFDSSGTIINNAKLNQQSSLSSPVYNTRGGISYTYPIKRSLVVDANYDYNNNHQNNNKTTYNYDSLTGRYDVIDTLTTNRFTNTLETHKVNIGLNQFGKSFRYQAGLAVQFSHQYNHNFTGPGMDIQQRLVNWFPRAGFFYTINKQQQINFNYSGNTMQATIDQLAPLPDFSNPLLIRKGNPDLQPEFDHNFLINYNHFSKDRLKSLLITANLNLAENKLTQSSTIIAGGVQQIQYVNTNGNWSSNLSVNYNFPFSKGRKGNAKIGTAIRYTNQPNFVNAVFNTQKIFSLNPDLSINYSPVDRLLLETDINLSFNKTSYGYSQSTLQQFNQHYAIGVSYELPAGVYVQTDLMITAIGPQASLPAQTTSLWNANLSKRILRKKTAELRLSAFDILKSNKGFSQSTGENYIASSNNLILTRTVFVSFIYYFKAGLK